MAKKRIPILVKDKMYIPQQYVDVDKLQELYERQLFNESACAKCEFINERPCDTCETCPNNLGIYRLFSEKEIKEIPFWAVPLGNRSKIKELLPDIKDFKILDRRPLPAFRHELEMTRPLYEFQTEAIATMIKKGYGTLKSPPRTGKTVMGTAISCAHGLKTLILADQNDLLEQFLETIYGNAKEEGFTNAAEIDKFNGCVTAAICKDPKEFHKYDIVLATYQSFISENGKRRLKQIKNMFGTLIVDECHATAAKEFSRVINNLNCRYKYGLTATPKRKDGMDFVTVDILGPVVAKTTVKTLKPIVFIHETHVASKTEHKNWTYANRFLERHEERNRIIVRQVVKDLKAGRHIVIPLTFSTHIDKMVQMINKAVGKPVCGRFDGRMGKVERRKTILRARKGTKIKVVVGMRKIIQKGINVPMWDTIYEVMPISNPPNFEQEINRICTPLPGKPKPIVRHFIDQTGVSKGCFRTCYFQGYVKLGFDLPPETRSLAKKYTQYVRKGHGGDDMVVKKASHAAPKRSSKGRF